MLFPFAILLTWIPAVWAAAAPGGTAVDAESEAEPRSLTAALGVDGYVSSEVALRLINAGVTTVILVIVYMVLRRLLRLGAQRNRGLSEFEYPLARLLRWVYLPLGLLLVLQGLGMVQLGELWTFFSAGLAMVAIGFVAVWSVLSNVSSTFMIFSSRLFKVGDQVELMEPTAREGLRGQVSDIGLLSTTITEADEAGGGIVRIPNNIFYQKALRIRLRGPDTDVQPAGQRTSSAGTPSGSGDPANGGGVVAVEGSRPEDNDQR